MTKTLIYLEESQKLRLKKEARRLDKSVAQVVREAIDEYLPTHRKRAHRMAVVGIFNGSSDNVSERHHEILDQIFHLK